MTLVRVEAERNIRSVTERESFEFPSLAPDESNLSPVGLLEIDQSGDSPHF